MSRRKRIFASRGGGTMGPRHQRRWLLRLGSPLLAVGLAWLMGLVLFSESIPTRPTADAQATDAIIVLTGGSERLKEGFGLLAHGDGRQMLISGVHEKSDIPALLQTAGLTADIWPSTATIDCCITIGYEASDTRGNAQETAEWMTRQNLRSLRLVTADYHMPRSLLEFHAAMPEVRIVPHPVFPETVKRDQWYLWPGTTSLIVREYHKYLAAMLRIRLDGLLGATT